MQRSAFAETTCFSVHQKLLQLLNGEMSWKENSSLLRLWPYHGCKIALIGLKVTEVAHDIQMQVARYVQDMGFVNSYDTWHGKYL